MNSMYTQGLPIKGVDKYTGRHASYFSIQLEGDDTSREFFAWSSISSSGSIDVRENTNPGSSMVQYQVIREEPPTFEIEVQLPYKEDGVGGAREVVSYLRAGRVMSGFNVGAPVGEAGGLYAEEGGLTRYGSWVIERASITISRDDFTNVRATVRALGYIGGQSIPAPPPMTANTPAGIPPAAP